MAQAAPGASPKRSGTDYSFIPYTTRGYVGLNLGRHEIDTACGIGFRCDDAKTGGRLYTGGLYNDWFGVELGLFQTGRADRAGGSVRARGLDLQLVLRAPLGAFNAFAKGGASYAQTRISADPLAGVATGSERGFGPTYALGIGYDFTGNSGLVLERSRHRLRLPGGGRGDLDFTSIGYVHRF